MDNNTMAKQMHVNDLAITLSNLLVDQKNNPIEYTIDELASFDMLRSVLSDLIPSAPKVTGKKVRVEQELDLAVPASREAWFRTLGMDAVLEQEVTVGTTSKGKMGIIGATLTLNGREVARIASENVMEAIFFDGIVKAFTVWREKGVKDPSADGKSASLGRLPGKEIRKMHEAGISAALIAEQIGRDEEAISEWIAKNC